MDNKIFIRERLNVVDYDNNNQGIIYTSSDIDIEGGAVNVQLESDVGGWHQLTFDMPAFIVEEGKHIQNPLLKHLFPLSKIQYTRVIKEKDKEKELILYFVVQPQDGTRDDSGIVLYNFTCIDYPRHYLSKAKNGITIGEDTLDEKRSMTPNNEIMNVDGKVIYVKAPVQSRTDFLNFEQLGTWGDAKPGAFAYIPSTKKAYRLTGSDPAGTTTNEKGETFLANWKELLPNQSYTIENDIPIPEPVWCPDWEGYPLEPDINSYDYGAIGINDIDPTIVQFYWDILWMNPEKTIGRFDGKLYQTNSRLVLTITKTLDYDFTDDFLGTFFLKQNLDELVPSYNNGATAYVIETATVWRYNGSEWEDTYQNKREAFKTNPILKGTFDKLDPMKPYLAPNYAEKYLDYILEGTGWKVGEVDKIMVDTSTVEFDENGNVHPKQQELTTFLYFDNSNAYNAITELCNSFKCYPRFDHVNKTVNLKAVPGLDYGLTYQWRDNLANTRITQDGEKAVSKLWVYGGEDPLGEVTIADCSRMNPDYYLADYTSLDDLEERVKDPKEGQYGKVTTTYEWGDLISQTLKDGKRLPIVNTFNARELTVTSWGTGSIPEVEDLSDLPETGSLGQTVFVQSQDSYWSWFPEGNTWYDTFQETEPKTDTEKIKFEQRYDYISGQWVDKGQFYHWYETLSPFADNYILDFSYFLDRNLMTKEQEDDIKYNYVLPISRLNKKRWPLYTEYQNLSNELLNWNNTYDASKIAADAIKNSLMSTYAIFQKGSDGKYTLKENGVTAYPPGANFKTGGWVKTEVAYSDSNATIYADFNSLPTNAQVGDMAKVVADQSVYSFMGTINFDDTICSRLGYSQNQITDSNADFKKRTKDLLYSQNKELEARQRQMGLFETLREEELVPRSDTNTTYAALKEWYNPPSDIELMPTPAVTDADESSTKHAYYSAKSRYITEKLTMDDALERIQQIETELTLLLEKIELLENQINQLEWSLRHNYGDFIVEGVFTDDTLVWKYNLWYAGLEALQLYHRPLVTYELGVVDVSGLPEYRTVTTDIYHDIVYRMNQAELVLPEPGDYCYVTDNTLGLVAEKANITSIIRSLSNPSQHQITIATVDTNTEDLIGKVVTAANTIYSKEQIYNRSAIIGQNGTIAQDSMMNSLEDSSGKLSFMSNSGTVVLGESGITTVDRNDATARMQYTGKGIFASTDGGVTWDNIVNAGKISIKSLSAGTIDSHTISVTNMNKDAAIIIDGKGISAINYEGTVSKQGTGDSKTTRFDPDHTAFFLDAQTGNAYFRGTIQAGAGDIGGWYIGTDALTRGNVGMNSNSSEHNGWAFWAGNSNPDEAPFRVDHNGNLYATKGNFTGAITGGSITGTSINNGNGTFRVDANGNLTATSANITGEIHANSGSFTGSINASTITGGTINGTTISGGQINIGSNFSVDSNGILHANGADINGSGTFTGTITATSGKIGSWYIDSDGFYNSGQTSYMYTDGRIRFTPDNGGRLNIGNNGIMLQGAGTGNKVIISDVAYDISQFPTTPAGTINLIGINGATRIACNDQISILAGRSIRATADAADNQLSLVGTRTGNGTSKDSSGVFIYTPGESSIRLNGGKNVYVHGGYQVVLSSNTSNIYISPGGGYVYFKFGETSYGFNESMIDMLWTLSQRGS